MCSDLGEVIAQLVESLRVLVSLICCGVPSARPLSVVVAPVELDAFPCVYKVLERASRCVVVADECGPRCAAGMDGG